MSYILDALNKAEQSRQQQQTPTSQTINTQTNATEQPSHNRTTWRFSFGLLAAALLLWLLMPEQPDTQLTSAATQAPNVLPTTQPEAKSVAPAPVEPIVEVEQSIAPPISEMTNLPTLSELPSEVLASLPAINISAHTYADDAAKRMVIINDKVMHEMRHVSAALLLREITPTGVILAYNGIAFSMTAFDTWPY